MTEVGSTYGEALYTLAREEGLSEMIDNQLNVLSASFVQEPDFVRLLSSPSLTKTERCQILEDSFRGKINGYVLSFLKILTEKGCMPHFTLCVRAYHALYNQDNGILPVTVITAVPMTQAQKEKLTKKLQKITGKHIELETKLDPTVLGGVRLDYDGKRVDDTVSHRLDVLRSMLLNTVL